MLYAKINNSTPVSLALILTWHMNVCISLSFTLRLTGSCMLNLGCSTNRKSIFEAVLRYLSLGRLSRLQLQIPISQTSVWSILTKQVLLDFFSIFQGDTTIFKSRMDQISTPSCSTLTHIQLQHLVGCVSRCYSLVYISNLYYLECLILLHL